MDPLAECQHIESLIGQSAIVQFCIVVGCDQPYLSALITPDKAALAAVLRDNDPLTAYNLDTHKGLNHIEVRSYYCDLLEQVNKQCKGKMIVRFSLIELSAAKSRDALCEENKVVIESFYQEYVPGIG
ncbi:hypothetical protein PAECIP111893_04086 [Paenibacillus plantiphilus]|uniref:Uncharacterized protein n=1 Tax=Paenibacillus plantiphilus TaxID=2905650 RepID=A0ABM9CJR8_9BACL|nr:hypothetical protein [Paenibacillus plantiphilus]CAH1216266.1 hypothetical protein PAECIP111893_04086 [Paenibacillus plantiphilus]